MKKLAVFLSLAGLLYSCGGGGSGTDDLPGTGNGGSTGYYVRIENFNILPTNIFPPPPGGSPTAVEASASLDYRTINGVVEIRVLATDGNNFMVLVPTFYCGGIWSSVCDTAFLLTCKYDENRCLSCKDPTDTSGQSWTNCVYIPTGTYGISLEAKGWVRFDQNNPADTVYKTLTVMVQ